MIRSYACAETQAFNETGKCPARWRGIQNVVRRKLAYLHAAGAVEDLRKPPGNRLEALKGDRKGTWSIRVNDQYRVCFRWTDAGPEDVEVVDYHA